MTHVIVKHEVKDYDAWRKGFDSVEGLRRSRGERSFSLNASAIKGLAILNNALEGIIINVP